MYHFRECFFWPIFNFVNCFLDTGCVAVEGLRRTDAVIFLSSAHIKGILSADGGRPNVLDFQIVALSCSLQRLLMQIQILNF